MWNVRRECLDSIFASCPPTEVQELCKNDLRFNEEAIKMNPKSYWVWNHRRWILEKMPEPEWEREMKLVTGMLSLDARNCWYEPRVRDIMLSNDFFCHAKSMDGTTVAGSSRLPNFPLRPRNSPTQLKRSTKTFPTTLHGITDQNFYPLCTTNQPTGGTHWKRTLS